MIGRSVSWEQLQIILSHGLQKWNTLLEVRKEQNREFGKAVSVEAFVTIAREWQWMV